jgi:hypothetical protein
MSADQTPETPLPPELAASLRKLRTPTLPSAELYAHVADGLRERGAFRPWIRNWRSVAGIAAALIVAFVGGRATRAPAAEPESVPGTDYVMLLLNTPAPNIPSGQTEMEGVAEYRDWATPFARAGRMTFGDEFAPSRYLVDTAGARAAEVAAGVAGMFDIRAADVDVALEIARTLPHVRQGGVVAVQPLMGR